MARGQISLNSVGYIINSFDWNRQGFALVHREISQPFAPQFRTEGVQQQADLRGASTKIFGPFSFGFGPGRIASDRANNPEEYQRFQDSSMETRWPDGARQSILAEDATETGLEQSIGGVNFKGDVWTVWGDVSGVQALSRKFDGSAWIAGGSLQPIAGGSVKVPLSIITAQNLLMGLVAGGDGAVGDDHFISFDANGAGNWTAATTQPTAGLLDADISAGDSGRFGLLVDLGAEVAAVLWGEAAGDIRFFSERGSGAVTWTDESLIITSANGPLGVAVYPGIDGTDKLYVLMVEGLWEIDFTGTWTAQKIRNIISVNSTGGALAVGDDGALWIAAGVSNDVPARVFRMFITDASTRRFELVPGDLSLLDDLPADMLGPIRVFHPSDGFMYASIGGGTVGGSTGRKARVICHNGLGWHHMTQVGTADPPIDWIVVSPNTGDTTRLHFGIRTAATTTDAQFLTHPNTNPESLTGTIKRTQATVLDLPFFDGGMPTTPGVILQTQMSATRLTDTSNEFVNVDYAVDGGTRGGTDLGNFDSGLFNKNWPKGATAGTGVEARNVALRLNMKRASGSPTNDPVMHSITQAYLKQPSVNQRYIVRVDIQATADIDDKEPEAVITTLEAARDLSTLPAFEYGNSGVKHVKVRSIFWQEEIDGDEETAPDTLAQRIGNVILVLEEVV